MVFGGFQKLDLLNYPSHVAASVFTSGCNLRCPYCHNPQLAGGQGTERYTEDEVLDYVHRRRTMLEGFVVSGGEPTLQKDLSVFLEKIKAEGLLIKLDTNGLLPQVLENLLSRHLADYVALDVKLPPDGYSRLGPTPEVENPGQALLKSIELLRESGAEWEVRTTYLPQFVSEEDLVRMTEQVGKVPVWYIQPFNPGVTLNKEFAGFGTPDGQQLQAVVERMRALGINAVLR